MTKRGFTERARRELGVELVWIFDLGRAWQGGETETQRWAAYTVDVAIEAQSEGVVALGLGSPEVGHPPEPFAPLFARGRAAGLHSAPRAGERVGPASIWGALNALGAERIAHGDRAVEDPALVAELTRRGGALDLCPTSNVRLGVYSNLSEHPPPHLYAAGVAIILNSDDPPLFGTTLNDEVALLADPCGPDVSAIVEILLNTVRHCFLPAPEKVHLEEPFRAELDALKVTHLAALTPDPRSSCASSGPFPPRRRGEQDTLGLVNCCAGDIGLRPAEAEEHRRAGRAHRSGRGAVQVRAP